MNLSAIVISYHRLNNLSKIVESYFNAYILFTYYLHILKHYIINYSRLFNIY